MRRAILTAWFLTLAAGSSKPVDAQLISEGGIQGSGSVTIERPAERLRLQIVLTAKSSKDLPDAVKKMKERRAKVEKQLESLGVIKQSVKFTDLKIDDTPAMSAHGAGMMAVPAGGPFGAISLPGGAHGPGDTPPVHKLIMTLTADWALKSTDPIALLLEGTKIQDAIKKADLAGLEDELTAEEEEEEEEMAVNVNGMPMSHKPGEPDFVYLTTIPEADYNKALAEAFQSAKGQAENVSKAIGVPLDALKTVQTMGQTESEDGDAESGVYYVPGNYYSQSVMKRLRSKSNTPEALGSSPGILKYKVAVTAIYSLKATSK